MTHGGDHANTDPYWFDICTHCPHLYYLFMATNTKWCCRSSHYIVLNFLFVLYCIQDFQPPQTEKQNRKKRKEMPRFIVAILAILTSCSMQACSSSGNKNTHGNDLTREQESFQKNRVIIPVSQESPHEDALLRIYADFVANNAQIVSLILKGDFEGVDALASVTASTSTSATEVWYNEFSDFYDPISGEQSIKTGSVPSSQLRWSDVEKGDSKAIEDGGQVIIELGDFVDINFSARIIKAKDQPIPSLDKNLELMAFALLGESRDENTRFCKALFGGAPAIMATTAQVERKSWIRPTFWPDARLSNELNEVHSCSKLIEFYDYGFSNAVAKELNVKPEERPSLIAIGIQEQEEKKVKLSLRGLSEFDMAYIIAVWDAATLFQISDVEDVSSGEIFVARLRSFTERVGSIFTSDGLPRIFDAISSSSQ